MMRIRNTRTSTRSRAFLRRPVAALVVLGALFALLAAESALAQSNRVRVTLLDEDGRPRDSSISVEVETINFRTETVRLRLDSGDTRTFPFARIEAEGLYTALFNELRRLEESARTASARRDLGYAHLVAARVCVARDRLTTADQHLRQAESFDAALADVIASERALIEELRADGLLRQAIAEIEAGQLTRARSTLDQIARRHPDTAAASHVAQWRARIEQLAARAAPTGRERPRPDRTVAPAGDPLAPVYERVARADAMRQQGHEQLAIPDSRCMTTWRGALEALEARNGAVALLDQAVRDDSDGTLAEADVASLRLRIRQLQLDLYKAKTHYLLFQGPLETARERLQRALALDPTDRELLHLEVLYHSAVRWLRGQQGFDQPEPEEPPAEPEDPNPREPDQPPDDDE